MISKYSTKGTEGKAMEGIACFAFAMDDEADGGWYDIDVADMRSRPSKTAEESLRVT